MKPRIPLILALVPVLLATACIGGSARRDGPLNGESYVIGAKDFTEQDILANLTALLLQRNGADAQVKSISGSANIRTAMESGDMSMYWEYTGTAWISYQHHTEPIRDPGEQFAAVRDEDAAKNGIAWFDPAGLDNSYALAVRSEFAKEHRLATVSDLARLARRDPAQATVCVESEFASRDDGLPGLLDTYGINLPKSHIKTLDGGVIYHETDKGRSCNVGEVFATDGRVSGLGLTLLKDDERFLPHYQGALTMMEKTAKERPELARIMAPLAQKLDTPTMRALNAQVDIEGLDPDDVAERWLKHEGLW
ncbi:glycine betaine ABC transporter substrate-binding protein [Streptomyces sp. NPDC051218]|uniref:glycine betaine ABC transporter substrate-binding protein n=1 Tax=Streptomyces sp. NPDC051218 TaxID=3365645 RepID=UPI0037924FF2